MKLNLFQKPFPDQDYGCFQSESKSYIALNAEIC